MYTRAHACTHARMHERTHTQHAHSTHLCLQFLQNLLPCQNDPLCLAGDHDGEAVVSGLTDLNVTVSLAHHISNNLGLCGLPSEGFVQVTSSLLHGNMEHLVQG